MLTIDGGGDKGQGGFLALLIPIAYIFLSFITAFITFLIRKFPNTRSTFFTWSLIYFLIPFLGLRYLF
jgi:hypothetical protein